MSVRYHISPKTGRPSRCLATAQSCPIGGYDNHFVSRREARLAYETKMQNKTHTSLSKKKFKKHVKKDAEREEFRAALIRETEENYTEIISISREKKALRDSGLISEINEPEEFEKFDGWGSINRFDGFENKSDESKEAHLRLNKLREREEDLKNNQFVVDEKIQILDRLDRLSDEEATEYHKSHSRITEAIASPGKNNDIVRYEVKKVGTLNPTTGAVSAESSDWHPERDSLTIFGNTEGDQMEVMAMRGEELYEEPIIELGRPVLQNSRGMVSDNKTDLVVLGYVDRTGNRYGWVPDENLQHLIYEKKRSVPPELRVLYDPK